MRCIFCFLLIVLFCNSTKAQNRVNRFTLSGYVKDSKTGEALLSCNVVIKELQKGTVTNTYGFYSLTIDSGSYTLLLNYIGYKDQLIPVSLTKDQTFNIELEPFSIETKEVEIKGERADRNVNSTEMGRIQLDVEKIKTLPAFMGEVDLLKTIQLLPGVQSAGEGNSGFYVRGGGPDQNLVLLDEAVVYNASHLFGFFSVFNADAVKNITLTKGGMPAQYGGRLASVLDISMKEGNNKEFHGSGGLGYIASRLTLEGPIIKNKASYIISARRIFIDLFLREPFVKEGSAAEGNSYYFYDLNTKINYTLSQKDRLYLSGYFGRDVFNFKSKATGFKVRIPWGNSTASLRWNHLFNDRLFLNTSLIYSDYNFEFQALQQQFDFRIFSGIRDYNVKADFNYFPSILHNVKFGFNYVYHRLTPTNAYARSGDVVFDLGETVRLYAHDAAIYVSDEWDITERFRLNAGLRGTLFIQTGPFTRYVIDPVFPTKFTDTIYYDKGDVVKRYNHVEPRLSMRYELNKVSSLKASYTQNYQYIHLASISSASLPTDVWVPSSDRVKPQFGTQYALGYFRNFKDNEYETSIEGYYKTMKNQIEYREGAQPDQDVKNNTDNNFVFGEGWSYGLEFFVKKAMGDFSGWVGYTLAWTNRKFPDLNRGATYPAKYDRRHDVSIVLSYSKNKRWTFGLIWVYATGDALSLQNERYTVAASPPVNFNQGTTSSNFYLLGGYGERNDFRQKAYHRLDLSATRQGKKHKQWQGEWNFSIYNVYCRLNPYFIYFNQSGNTVDGTVEIQAKQVSLFPIIPSATYNFKF